MKLKISLVTGTNEIMEIEAEEGQNLYEVLAAHGVQLSAPCGGRGRCGKCKVELCDGIKTETVLACRTLLKNDCTVRLISAENKILTGGRRKAFSTDGREGLALAVDVGTTTVAAYLLDSQNGIELASDSFLNPQRIHGADVISRMSFACEGRENALLMQRELLDLIDEAEKKMIAQVDVPVDSEVCERVLVGNTAMMHIASGMDTGGISRAPYYPEYTSMHKRVIDGRQYIFGGCISGYVGADTVAAMLACEVDKANDNVLLIDIGTNGEIVLKANGKLSCCSCAAGPAFEGAHISCGTGAVSGAVDHLSAKDGGFAFTTISGADPSGICGSGLVDAVAYLMDEEHITPMGRMKERFVISNKVYIEPSDIREVQLAKAAIAAGIEILADRAGISLNEIDRVLLAGGFGNYIDVHSACKIGLLPSELEQKVIPVGNAAGDGAKMLALSKNATLSAEKLRLKTSYIELSAQEDFEDIYTDNLIFEID